MPANKVQIDTVVNADGVAPGVATTADGLKQIGAAAGEADAGLQGMGDSLEKASDSTGGLEGKQLASIRTSHHLFEALVQISEGGPQAAAGMAMLTRIMTEMGETSMGAMGNVVLIISTLAAVGIPLLMRAFGQMEDKAGGAKAQADELAASLGKVNEATGSFQYENYGAWLKDLIEATSQINQQVAGLREVQRAQDELKSAQLAARIAQLDDQQAHESEGKNPEERAAIQRRYDRERLQARQQFDAEKAKADLDAAKQAQLLAKQEADANKLDLGLNEEQQQDMLNGRNAAQAGIPGMKNDVQSVQDRITALENKRDSLDVTGSEVGLTGKEKIEYAQLQALLPQLAQRQATSQYPAYDMQLEGLKAEHGNAEADLKKASEDKDVAGALRAQQVLTATGQQIEAIENFTKTNEQLDKAWQESLEAEKKLTAQRLVLSSKLAAASTEVETARVKADTVGVKQGTELLDLQDKQRQQVSLEQATATINMLKREVADLQEQLKNPALSEDQRAAIQQQITDKTAQQKARQTAYEDKYGLLTPSQSDLQHTEVRDDMGGAQFERDKADQKAGVQKTSPIDAATTDAMSQTVNASLDSLNDGVAAHERIYNQVMKLPDVISRLAQLGTDTAGSLDAKLQAIESKVSAYDKQLDDIRRATSYGNNR